jgi:hypothetical protein
MIIQYPVTYTNELSFTNTIRARVPIRYPCPDLPPNFIFNESESWNCNLCGSDLPFFTPYVSGDIIPFQTRFVDEYNQPSSILTSGFRTSLGGSYFVMVEVIDCCDNIITKNIDDFCDEWYVGHSDETGSVQTFFVNTGLISVDCFKLRITFRKIDPTSGLPVDDRIIFTEYYKEIPACGFTESVLIESTYSQFDCDGLFYGQLRNTFGVGNSPYYNSIRLFGNVEFIGDSESVTENDRNVVISKQITKNYKIISGVYPPYYVQKLAQTVRGFNVSVDGNVYQNFAYDQKPDDSRMFGIDLTFDDICRIDNRRCDI